MPSYTASRLKFWSGCDKSLRQKDVRLCLSSPFTLAEKGRGERGDSPYLSLATSFGPLWPRDLAHQTNKTG